VSVSWKTNSAIVYFVVKDNIGISSHILGKRLPRVSSSSFQEDVNA